MARGPAAVFETARNAAPASSPVAAVLWGSDPVGAPVPSLRVFERQMIERALAECGGNLTRAAHALGIPRTTLAAKVRRIRQERGE